VTTRTSDLTQALQKLNDATVQKVNAEVNYQIDLAQDPQVSGCLLGHAGVDWDLVLIVSAWTPRLHHRWMAYRVVR
jgi:hypothetical protein